MKIRNPIGPKVSLGNGYYYQRICLSRANSYVKLWHRDKVIDRALTVPSAKAMARRYAERQLLV